MDRLELADVLAIWPIAKSFALHTPVGDLITLSRTNSSLRSSLHGCIPLDRKGEVAQDSRGQRVLIPEIGKHQTSDWAYLKSVAPLLCSVSTHIRGRITKPCVYCSMPICDACIVRDAFKHGNENTFKNRLRHYCPDCWSDGRPCRSFRYPAVKVDTDGIPLETPTYVRSDDDEYGDLSTRCECNFQNNSWLCIECKEKQNSSSLAPLRLSFDQEPRRTKVQCYGLGCENMIYLDSPEKDRRRLCLWCEKPARRQFSSEDRMIWNMKTIEARRRNAESRQQDVAEYNRQRFKTMRMSRREMRGTCGPDDDKPIFVRHLDTVNYRNWISEASVPTPEAVWKSKNGYWRYEPGFLLAVRKLYERAHVTQVNNVSVSEMYRLTREGCSEYARLNREWYDNLHQPHRVTHNPVGEHTKRNRKYLNELKVRILDLHLAEGKTLPDITRILDREYGLSFDNGKYVEPGHLSYYIQRWKQEIDVLARFDVQYGSTSSDGNGSGSGSSSNNKDKPDKNDGTTTDKETWVKPDPPKTANEEPLSPGDDDAMTSSYHSAASTTTSAQQENRPAANDYDNSDETSTLLTYSSPLEQVDSTATTLADINININTYSNSNSNPPADIGSPSSTVVALTSSRSIEDEPPPYVF